MVRRVEVLPYDPTWPAAFCCEAGRLVGILGRQIVVIHHIGSTSVTGLWAKPIIDVLVEVRDIAAIDRCDGAMVAAGYIPKGENGLPGRRLYIKGTEEHRTHHVHIYAVGHPGIERHLALRDYMRCHPEAVQAYGALKRDLAKRYSTDIDSYVEGKDAFVRDLERQALSWRQDGD